ncbi:MAG: lipid-A-disaccharide synthase N-terminal domain-containing protein [Muribaculaceae bacterium]|nr:lipid-A-disaccharide synthase N-terminal domain-containing protein [Muribaculaceae bacterium]
MVFVIGFLAQALFSARVLVQWIMSERARRVLSPTIFWVLSLLASCMLCFYGWLRDDFAIVMGQVIAYYIYIWNLSIKGVWHKVPALLRAVIVLLPLALIIPVAHDAHAAVDRFFGNDDIPLWMVIYGSAGQVIFTFRFIYQWLYSRRRGESELPGGFWIISLTGSLIIVSYAIFRHDPVLILGQSVGLIAYTRNLMLWYRRP